MRQWYVLRTKPRKDAAAASLLEKAKLEVFAPTITVYRAEGKRPAQEPLFPGYMFSRLDAHLGEVQLARYTAGVSDILRYGNHPAPVPDELVEAVRQRTASGPRRRQWSSYQSGDLVVITKGPFRDFEAVFDGHLSAAGRVRVLIRTLRRLYRADVHVSQLRLAGKAAGLAPAA